MPQAYPVSTNKPKIGSIIFLLFILGYLIYDFYKFITNNIPIANAIEADLINKGNFSVPEIAFGMYYSDPNPKSSTQIHILQHFIFPIYLLIIRCNSYTRWQIIYKIFEIAIITVCRLILAHSRICESYLCE